MQNSSPENNQTTIIETERGVKNGQDKCPKCGSTDITLNINTGKLVCEFCRYEFEPETNQGFTTDISNLQGQVMGSGTQNINSDATDVITLKCSSCGAEVVVDTSTSTQARCHWCRNMLSINEQIPNGSVPDAVLPFKITKEEAAAEIEKFVGNRKFFANTKFKQEFTTENIMGVYFPYMVVDVNAHAILQGEGEHLVRSYVSGNDNDAQTYYDADLYHVERDFDLTINNLTIESSSDKLNNNSDKTNNVINAIMPFDTENCVKYNANYLKGYTSEKRDTNIQDLKPLVYTEAKDIARFAANDYLKQYDRGVKWTNEQLEVKGEQWQSAYLPVWLYSYQEVNGSRKILHYVAVNARTKETMGSVPIHIPKLLGISFLVEILGFIAMMLIDFDYNYLFLSVGFIYFIIMYLKYRNTNARHKYETETKKSVTNLKEVNQFIKHKPGQTNAKMIGANNKKLNGTNDSFGEKMLNSITEDPVIKVINNTINKEE